MSINFLVRINKSKGPRVNIVRPIKDSEGKRANLTSLGSLPADLTQPMDALKEKLDEFEQYQLENYVKNIAFNERHFHSLPDQVHRDLIYFPSNFNMALFELWQLAKKHDIDFTPHEVMLTALLNKAKDIERQLNEKLDKPIAILESASAS